MDSVSGLWAHSWGTTSPLPLSPGGGRKLFFSQPGDRKEEGRCPLNPRDRRYPEAPVAEDARLRSRKPAPRGRRRGGTAKGRPGGAGRRTHSDVHAGGGHAAAIVEVVLDGGAGVAGVKVRHVDRAPRRAPAELSGQRQHNGPRPLPEEAIQPQLAERPRPSQAPTNR